MSNSTAVAAGPQSAQSKTPWHMIVPVIAGALCGCCLGFAAGVPAGWLARGGVQVAAKNPVANAKNHEEWGFQDLQDHLASKGMKLSRDGGQNNERKDEIWFFPGDKKSYRGIGTRNDRRENIWEKDVFIAIDHGSANAAQQAGQRIKDAQQRDVLIWGRFVIEGSQETRAKLLALLPK